MSARRPYRKEGVVFREIREVIEASEKKNGPWPELDEPKLELHKESPPSAARVVLWTMAGVIGATTIYAIATGDRELLIAILGVAAGALIRCTRSISEDKKKNDNERETNSS